MRRSVLVGSFFQGMPAGGSLSRTGINESGGARTRWSGVYAGLALALVLVLFGNLAELIPMTGLAALLIVIGFEVMIKESRVLREAFKLDRVAALVAVIVIVIAVFDDLTVAIFAGVVMSLLLFTFKAASKVNAASILRREDGRFEFGPVPEKLPPNQVTAIELVGTVFFASVYSYDELLPDYKGTMNAVLIVNMRGRQSLSETALEFGERYAAKLHASGNQLMLCNVNDTVLEQLKATETYALIGEENIFLSSPIFGASLEEAWLAAEKWISARKEEGETDGV